MEYNKIDAKSIQKALNEIGTEKLWKVSEEDWGQMFVYFNGELKMVCDYRDSLEDIIKNVNEIIQHEINNEKRFLAKLSNEYGMEVKYAHLTEKQYGIIK